MLTDLESLQSSDESVECTTVSFDIETRSDDGDEIIERVYTFSHAPEWDKWVFTEFCEKRTPIAERVSERNWRKSRHVLWSDPNETRTIEVPPEVSKRLAEVTGATSVTIQVPTGGIDVNNYHEFTYEIEASN
jgi:hypothetical protein